MASPAPDPEAAADPRTPESDGRVAGRSRIAGIALILVLLSVSVFAVWSSQVTSTAADRAVAADYLSERYARASTALGAQESLERRYRLGSEPEVRDGHHAAVVALAAALGEVRQAGDASDRAFVDSIMAQHRGYRLAVDRLFAAVDRGDAAAVLQIDRDEVDPMFASIEKAVSGASVHKRQVALAELADLKRLEALTRKVTPWVFLLGLALAAGLRWMASGDRRLLEAERARAVHDSLHDHLTGLPNRTLVADRLGQALRVDARMGTSTGVLMFDLDRFKEINDTFGHHYGDQLLIQVGARLANGVRNVDTVARLGGDEFAVLLMNVGDLDNATAVASKLRSALETPFHVEGIDLDVEASVGVVLSGTHGLDTTTLLRRVDVAMYVAKARNLGVYGYAPDADAHTPTKLALLGDLRRALERDELILHYQPKLNVSTGDVVGVEALIRWQHPERGMVFPDEFIPLAEQTGLIGPITHHVLDLAIKQARVWSDAGRPLTISVNLSARNLLDEGLPGQVAELLATHGVAADLLILEVTESAIMTEPARAQQLLEQLPTLGIRVSIDDFGAGYTSLGQLTILPISELKIDRSFVMAMTEDHSNALIVRSVIDLGHNLGFTLVAEGVETQQVLTALANFGCDIAQGYHIARPMTAAAFDTWCDGRRITPIHRRAGVSPQCALCADVTCAAYPASNGSRKRLSVNADTSPACGRSRVRLQLKP